MINLQAVSIERICREIDDMFNYWRDSIESIHLTKLERIDVFEKCKENPHALSRLYIEGDSFRISLYAEKIREACIKLDIDAFSVISFLLSHELGHYSVYANKVVVENEEKHCDEFAIGTMETSGMRHSSMIIKKRLLSLRNYEI